MMMIARSAEYEDVLNSAKDRKVSVWTCNTCARMCNGVGGQQAADRLAAKLKEDGVDVRRSMSVSAACLMSKVNAKAAEMSENADAIVSLTCDVGVLCAARAFGKDVIAPLITLGSGYIDGDGTLIVTSCNGLESPAPLNEVAEKKGLSATPLV